MEPSDGVLWRYFPSEELLGRSLDRLEQWRNMFEVNVIGMVTSIKHLKKLLDKGEAPAIVNMSSISGYIGSVGYAAYCSTKGAVDSLTKSLALEKRLKFLSFSNSKLKIVLYFLHFHYDFTLEIDFMSYDEAGNNKTRR